MNNPIAITYQNIKNNNNNKKPYRYGLVFVAKPDNPSFDDLGFDLQGLCTWWKVRTSLSCPLTFIYTLGHAHILTHTYMYVYTQNNP